MTDPKRQFIRNYLSNTQAEIQVASFTKVGSDWRMLDYTPSFNRFYLIVEGEGWVKIGDHEYYPKPGQLFVLPAGIKQSYSYINENGFLKYWCHFTAMIGEFHLFNVLNLPPFIDVPDMPYLIEQFQKLIDYGESHDLTAMLRSKSVLFDTISYYIDHALQDNVDIVESASMKKVSVVLKYIEQHLSEDITVETLAGLLHFHPNYFIQLFKKVMGETPIHYINKIKMEKAKAELASTDKIVSEIADGLGMQLHYFSRSFKHYSGFSPTQFRETMKRK